MGNPQSSILDWGFPIFHDRNQPFLGTPMAMGPPIILGASNYASDLQVFSEMSCSALTLDQAQIGKFSDPLEARNSTGLQSLVTHKRIDLFFTFHS